MLVKVELAFCRLLIVAFATLLVVNVAKRYLFNAPIYFAEELAVYILIWMAFLAIAATVARREMIALTFAVDALPAQVRRVIDLAVIGTTLAIAVLLLVVSWQWLFSPAVRFEQALTLGIAKRPFLAIVPIFFTLISFHLVANMVERWREGAPGAAA